VYIIKSISAAPENAVCDEILAKPVEHRADERADDDNGETQLRVEILPDVEIAAEADRTDIHP
jgi:hypothetical protein